MASFHFSAKIVSRAKGQSAVAKAAYNARAELINEETGQSHDYARADGLMFEGIFAPKDAPAWARSKKWTCFKRKHVDLVDKSKLFKAAAPH